MDEPFERKADRGLKPRDAERCTVVFERLFVGVVRCVVGRDRVDGAVGYRFDDGLAVLLAAKRRCHFCVRIVR